MKRACVNVTCLSRMTRKDHVRFLGGKGIKTRPTRLLVALVLYGLSAPHTASVFDKLTPGWGWIAPIGVEFGLLYTAFRRRVSLSASEKVSWTLWFLEVLLFLTAMLVNGAGAFTSVVTSIILDQLSFAALVEQFGNLPATSQAALIMAVLSAFIIPIGTLVAGEGLALLVLEQRTGLDTRESQWQEVAFTTTYRALFVRHLQSGLPDKDARHKALAEVKGYLSAGRPSGVRSLSAGSGQDGQANGQPENSAKVIVCRYLEQHADAEQLSVNQLWERLHREGVQVGRTTVAQALKEQKQRQLS